jgi:hypothetical protein
MDWDGLIEIFNPGHRHFAEERDRKRIEAQIPGNEGDPNRTWVDLDKGVVHLAMPPERNAGFTVPEGARGDEDEDA